MTEPQIGIGQPRDVMIGFVYGGALDPAFVRSLFRTVQSNERIMGVMLEMAPSGMVPAARNGIARKFLQSDCQWLLWLNTDKVWEPSEVTKILKTAEENDFKVVSAHIRNPGPDQTITMPVMVDDRLQPIEPTSDADFIPVFCAGMGFYLTHRSVLEAVKHAYAHNEPNEWFDYGVWEGRSTGEDLVFSQRLKRLGIKTYVDQSLKVGHRKIVALYPPQFL